LRRSHRAAKQKENTQPFPAKGEEMSALYHTETAPQLICWDRKYYSNFQDQLKALQYSRTVYVGNLSFFTTEAQILETFGVVGPVKRVIMGLNSITKTPCGFCFVEYYNPEHMRAALKYVSGTVCDDRVIRCDADGGFKPGRQFGRGRSGGQIRDERRDNIDPSRGGMMAQQQQAHQSSLGKSKRGDRDDEPQQDERNLAQKLNSGLSTSR
jgi:nuclear cap-binding protein subunit 2